MGKMEFRKQHVSVMHEKAQEPNKIGSTALHVKWVKKCLKCISFYLENDLKCASGSRRFSSCEL